MGFAVAEEEELEHVGMGPAGGALEVVEVAGGGGEIELGIPRGAEGGDDAVQIREAVIRELAEGAAVAEATEDLFEDEIGPAEAADANGLDTAAEVARLGGGEGIEGFSGLHGVYL